MQVQSSNILAAQVSAGWLLLASLLTPGWPDGNILATLACRTSHSKYLSHKKTTFVQKECCVCSSLLQGYLCHLGERAVAKISGKHLHTDNYLNILMLLHTFWKVCSNYACIFCMQVKDLKDEGIPYRTRDRCKGTWDALWKYMETESFVNLNRNIYWSIFKRLHRQNFCYCSSFCTPQCCSSIHNAEECAWHENIIEYQ